MMRNDNIPMCVFKSNLVTVAKNSRVFEQKLHKSILAKMFQDPCRSSQTLSQKMWMCMLSKFKCYDVSNRKILSWSVARGVQCFYAKSVQCAHTMN